MAKDFIVKEAFVKNLSKIEKPEYQVNLGDRVKVNSLSDKVIYLENKLKMYESKLSTASEDFETLDQKVTLLQD